jgi:class 3 adenylate cyclase
MTVNKFVTTCFTDIEDSAAMTEKLGHKEFGELRNKYFAVCEALAKLNSATVIKNTGDGHMITFDDIDSPLKFAAQLQEFYKPQPNFEVDPIVRTARGLN